MARSVSIPTGAVKVAYADASKLDEYLFDAAVSDLRWSLRKRYPSLRLCNEWVGREDRAVLANDNAFITVSEYCGLVAVCVVPKTNSKAALAWCNKVNLDTAVSYFGLLLSKGRFSNGEAISSNWSRW